MKRLGFIIQMANHEAKTKEKQQRSKTRKGPEPKQNTHTKTTRFAFDTGGSPSVSSKTNKNMHIETVLLLSAAQQTV